MQLTPAQLTPFLTRLAEARLFLSTMIWGPPGIGKSSIVAQVAQAVGIELIDVRLSQLAPTDLRGLPDLDAIAAGALTPPFPAEPSARYALTLGLTARATPLRASSTP